MDYIEGEEIDIHEVFDAIFSEPEDKDLKRFIFQFYQRLKEYSIVDESSHRLSRPADEVPTLDRRLDSIARLLVGDEVCAAVCWVNKTLLIATNQNKHTHETYRCPLWTRMFQLMTHLGFLSELAVGSGDVIVTHDYIGNTRRAFIWEALPPYLLYRLKQNNSIEPDDLERMRNFVTTVSDSFTQHKPKVECDLVESWACKFQESGMLSITSQQHGIKFSEREKDLVLSIFERFFQDLVKVEEMFSNIRADKPLMNFVDLGGAKVHAEMRLIEYLHAEGLSTKYIGISKLCCAHCCLAVKTFNLLQTYDEESKSEYDEESKSECLTLTRGFHGNLYYWPLSKKLSKDESFLRKLFGKKLYSLYKSFKTNNNQIKLGNQIRSKAEVALLIVQSIAKLTKKQLEKCGGQIKRGKQAEAADSSIDFSRTPSYAPKTKEVFFEPNIGARIEEGEEEFEKTKQVYASGEYRGFLYRTPLSDDRVEEESTVEKEDEETSSEGLQKIP